MCIPVCTVVEACSEQNIFTNGVLYSMQMKFNDGSPNFHGYLIPQFYATREICEN